MKFNVERVQYQRHKIAKNECGICAISKQEQMCAFVQYQKQERKLLRDFYFNTISYFYFDYSPADFQKLKLVL